MLFGVCVGGLAKKQAPRTLTCPHRSPLSTRQDALYGKEVIVADREMVESVSV